MLELARGDDNTISIIVKRPRVDPDTGEVIVDVYGEPLTDPVDLSDASLTFTARDRKKVAIITLTNEVDGGIMVPVPATSGRATAFIPSAMTEDLPAPYFLKYDVQLVEADDTKTTVARGDAVLREDVTRT